MNTDDSKVLSTKLQEDIDTAPEDIRDNSMEFAKEVYKNSESFMIFIDTLKLADDNNKSDIKFMDIAMVNVITTLAMDNTKTIDEAIAKLKEWFKESFDVIKDCDKVISKSG